MATSPDVETLEREAAEARARLAGTISRLTSPETTRAVKQELTDYVEQKKNEMLGAGRSRAQGFTDGLRERALSQPVGLALIGAGVAWRLYRHPPVATALIGTGVALLMKGDGGSARRRFQRYHDPYNREHPATYVPGGVAGYGYPVEENPPSAGLTDRASAAALQAGITARHLGESAQAMASDAKQQVSGMVEGAQGMAYNMKHQVSDMVGSAATSAANAAEATRTAVTDTVEAARATVAGAAETARSTVYGAVSDATTAVSDATGRAKSTITHTTDYAVRRAGSLTRHAPSNPFVLGALGLALGTALAYSLRSGDNEGRQTSAGRPQGGRNARGARSGQGPGVRRTAEVDDRRSTGAGTRRVVSRASERAGDGASSATDTLSGAAGAAGRVVGAAGETVSSTASSAYAAATDAASSVYRGAADLAASATRRAPEAAGRVQQQISELGERYPLLLGAVSLAVGAAVGGSLRLSESENRLMGSASDRIKQRAREMAGEQFGLAREAAEHFAGDLGMPFGTAGRTGTPPQDTSADFETVIGGGKPAVTRTTGNGGEPSPASRT